MKTGRYREAAGLTARAQQAVKLTATAWNRRIGADGRFVAPADRKPLQSRARSMRAA
jgi:hypothetical protein